MTGQGGNNASLPGGMEVGVNLVDYQDSRLLLEVRREVVIFGVPEKEVGQTLDDLLGPLAQNVERHVTVGSTE